MVNVKQKNVVKEMIGNGTRLSLSAMKESEVLSQAIPSMTPLCDVQFVWLLQTIELYGDDSFKAGQAVISIPPCICPLIFGLPLAELARLILETLRKFVKFISALKDLVVHQHCLCSTKQLKPCFELL